LSKLALQHRFRLKAAIAEISRQSTLPALEPEVLESRRPPVPSRVTKWRFL